MAVAVLLITHGRLSQNLVETVTEMLGGRLSLATDVLEVRTVQDPELLVKQGLRLTEKLDQGDGVLLLTDAFGSTPSNIANKVAQAGRCRVVAGVNLPMLIRIYNYPKLKLDALARTAVEGGQRGVMLCEDRHQ
ncbi:PTS system fructose subfamily IIA component [Oceanococcus atlanticus]|uniref:PTS system fructose subfamily IIA component n=1 Tax=Oceanococcus atlanticus TaxID=1317117 RepID=A0A1Y1SHG9_9GAMM|nr:PTS fructose transporter subunit IIA [Oceanococcus atlanticus]ORE89113.1 PTS system fructose subfamily IIA component [Oceanococcus atlanticus]RZO85203.1 MAG: PTS fructose transporter subunit IIA [Oceanococcus sp.]